MKTEIRVLQVKMRGKDVTQLQNKLRQLGFRITEKNGYFGKTTEKAVQKIQSQYDRKETGVVDENIAKLIDIDFAALVGKLNKKTLLALDKEAGLSPGEIGKKNPQLHVELEELARDQIKGTLSSLFKGTSPTLKKHISSLDLSDLDLSKPKVLDLVRRSLEAETFPESARKEGVKLLDGLADGELFFSALDPDIPLADQPIAQVELMRARLQRVAELAGLDESKAKHLLNKTIGVAGINETLLSSLKNEGKLEQKEADRLGLVVGLHQLTGGDFALTAHLKTEQFVKLGGKAIGHVQDLLAFEQQDWLDIIGQANVDPPEGMSREAFAGELSEKIARVYPSDALRKRMPTMTPQNIAANLQRLAPLFANNDSVLAADNFECLNQADLTESQKQMMRNKFVELKELSNCYRGLEIAGIIDDQHSSPEQKAADVDHRISLFKRFQKNNDELELLALDYSPDSLDLNRLKWKDIPKNEVEKFFIAQCKLQQRVYNVTREAGATKTILKAGYGSAIEIANSSLKDFQNETWFAPDVAETHYLAAQKTATYVSTKLGAIIDITHGAFNNLAVSNIQETVYNHLKKLDGYDELFGNQSFCRCEHCQSILSPAAYFADLMFFIKKNVIDSSFEGKEDHELHLKTRRRDLWKLPLSCRNTTKLVPTLDIVIEILENYIAGNVAPGSSLEKAVYKDKLSVADCSFAQPFFLPLEKLQIYLSHFPDPFRSDSTVLTRATVVKALGSDEHVLTSARLSLSKKEYDFIIRRRNYQSFQERVYSLKFEPEQNTSNLAKVDVQLMLKAMGLTRSELGDLIDTCFVTEAQRPAVIILAERKDQNSVQNDIEFIKNLNFDSLDRMHRFTRLWRKVPWTITELDLILSHLTSGELTDLSLLSQDLALQERLKVSPEQLCGLCAVLPTRAVTPQGKSLFDRLFNAPVFVNSGEQTLETENVDVKFTHPHFCTENPKDEDQMWMARLMAGLSVSSQDLGQLIRKLAVPLNVDPESEDTEKRGFLLNLENLSLLYRHALLAQRLDLSIDQIFQLIGFIKEIPDGYLKQEPKHIEALLDHHDRWKTTRFDLDDLGFIMGAQDLRPKDYPDGQAVAEMVNQIWEEIKAEKALVFADTVFAMIPEITESKSLKIIEANSKDDNSPAKIEETVEKDGFRLAATYKDTTELTIPNELEQVKDQLHQVLLRYHPGSVFVSRLASKLDLEAEKVREFIVMAGHDLNSEALALDLRGEEKPQNTLCAIVESLIPLMVLFSHKVFDTAALNFIRNKSEKLGIAGFNNLELDDIHKIATYEYFADTSEKAKFSSQEPEGGSEDVRHVLAGFEPLSKFSSDVHEALARILVLDPHQIKTIQDNVMLPDSPIDALLIMDRIANLIRLLGIDGDALKLMVSEEYDPLDQAGRRVLGAFAAKYGDEKKRKEALDPFEDKIRALKRDALTDYLINASQYRDIQSQERLFSSRDDIFKHFLIDVGWEGCARTSRLVAAISSLQLYVHRCLMNLEQDRRPANHPDKLHVLPGKIPLDQWDWRKNYRVFEANRKVFLYPERYILPDLRDNKTPPFEELETNLLQQEITEQAVLDAYGVYLNSFDEVAHLKIAGSYHQKDPDNEEDILHLFGVTPSDPPTYYYRTVENIHYEVNSEKNDRAVNWEPWQKIDVQIPVRKVSPVVFNGRLYVFWVEITTAPMNSVKGGTSSFMGYKHKLAVKYTSLRLDGNWTPPQKVLTESDFGIADNFTVVDSWVESFSGGTPEFSEVFHEEPQDEYTLKGFLWDQVYPEVTTKPKSALVVEVIGKDIIGKEMDFFRKILAAPADKSGVNVKSVSPTMLYCKNDDGKRILNVLPILTTFIYGSRYTRNSIVLEEPRINKAASLSMLWSLLKGTINSLIVLPPYAMPLMVINSRDELAISNGSVEDCLIDSNGDLFLLQRMNALEKHHLLRRLGTTMGGEMGRTLFVDGLKTFLSIANQENLKEGPLPFPKIHSVAIEEGTDKAKGQGLDYTGPFGVYFREMFFHIPFLIANHLNSQQQFAEAQRWYHFIFDPTASENTDPPIDRNWRYLEFRGLGLPSLKEIFKDKKQIRIYEEDPFNPHAIARLRLSAYQKCIVMKYIDNLLDWGDNLFSHFTTESVNEAVMLYVMASDILGDRPADVGKCIGNDESALTYKEIEDNYSLDDTFLIGLENETSILDGIQKERLPLGDLFVADALAGTTWASSKPFPTEGGGLFKGNTWKQTYTSSWAGKADNFPRVSYDAVALPDQGNSPDNEYEASYNGKDKLEPGEKDLSIIPDFALSIARQITNPAFCIPQNKELLRYWDRVEDRLSKIRNCMDIAGVRRQPALFAPEIDPMLLVRAKAKGLSIQDVLNATSGNLPPYRFTYLIEKAKSYAGVLQGFGSALLNALEKKDGEELNLLRAVHEQNILKLTSDIKTQEIETETKNIESLNQQKTNLQIRKKFYEKQISEGLVGGEQAQVGSSLVAMMHSYAAAELDMLASVTHLLPQVGSPFSMKFGGMEVGHSTTTFSDFLRNQAAINDRIASLGGLDASFERREKEWHHQKEVLDGELKDMEKRLLIAEIRKHIAEKSREVHKKTIEQSKEIYDFYSDKFSDLGLYTWLSRNLQSLYRDAYNNTLALARLAEQAYRFERGDDSMMLSGAGYWESGKAGLLAGERLLIELQNMERRFIETNYRGMEIEQSFSVGQINPQALLELREKGSCKFEIGEIFFNLFYPGQYRRRIKAVRLTIPCVTGPYTNVSANLTLDESWIRNNPDPEGELDSVPLSRSLSIATSRSQNDAGVFEFSFRDERYMPFEGMGAMSKWILTLPKAFRQFDYQSISDVILHINYTAEYDGLLAEKIEGKNAAIEGQLFKFLEETPLVKQFGLRQDYSNAFHMLLTNRAGMTVPLEIADKHLPIFIHGWQLELTEALLFIQTNSPKEGNGGGARNR